MPRISHSLNPSPIVRGGILAALAASLTAVAAPLTVDFTSTPLTLYPTSITTEADGIGIRITAWHVQFDGSTSTIFGPFPTDNGNGRRQVFGTCTGGICRSSLGLGLGSWAALGQGDSDEGGGGIQPGFDNLQVFGSPLSTQFALFEFTQPVDISLVTVDNVSNFGEALWAAGGTSAPDLGAGFLTAFDGFTVMNSLGLRSDRSTHPLTGFDGVRFFAVGAPMPRDIGTQGPFDAGSAQFYIDNLGISAAAVPTTPVPEPTTWAMLAAGLATLTLASPGRARLRNKRRIKASNT